MRLHPQRLILLAAVLVAVGYLWLRGGFVGWLDDGPPPAAAVAREAGAELATATFAGGCFWCVEADFDKVPGVVRTISGYTGGRAGNPTYAQVSRGGTGHAEAVQVVYDPAVVSYQELLDHFWRNVDPFVDHRQFCDVGTQYRPEIFVHSDAQRASAEGSRAEIAARFAQPVLVDVTPLGAFYEAETYHQDYYQKHPLQYRYYRWGCGRDARLAEIWGPPEGT
jgi:peptide-methionine (S)-S-oxide reductase